jgi:pyroglutamyl-peptidase
MDPFSPDQMQIVADVEHPNCFPSNDPQHIHISALQIPPTYDAAFDCVTALHARPPVIPPSNPPSAKVAPPPEHGYDFVFHVGLAGRGPFRIERLAHKSGYRMKDSSNQYAPIIEFLPEVNPLEPSQAEILDQMRISSANLSIMVPMGPVDTTIDHHVRGFGKGYELCAEDLHTMIDVEHLVYAMKEQGVEVCISFSLVLLRLIHGRDARFIRQWMLDIA